MSTSNRANATSFKPGNTVSADGRRWHQAIKQAALKRHGRSKQTMLEAAADTLVQLAVDGDIQALKEVGNRLDGMAHQSISVDQHSDRTVLVNLSFVKPANAIENQSLASLPDETVIHQPIIEQPSVEPVTVEQINQDEPLTER